MDQRGRACRSGAHRRHPAPQAAPVRLLARAGACTSCSVARQRARQFLVSRRWPRAAARRPRNSRSTRAPACSSLSVRGGNLRAGRHEGAGCGHRLLADFGPRHHHRVHAHQRIAAHAAAYAAGGAMADGRWSRPPSRGWGSCAARSCPARCCRLRARCGRSRRAGWRRGRRSSSRGRSDHVADQHRRVGCT